MKMKCFISPTLPQTGRKHRPGKILCGRKPRRRPKNPSPAQTRPLPTLPPLPPTPRPRRLASSVPAECSKLLKAGLQSRKDAIVVNSSNYTAVVTALSCRENSEHALIILPTRAAVFQISGLLREETHTPRQSRKTKVIVAVGKTHDGGGWKHPAMNANSAKHSVIVVATARGVVYQFFNSHGLPWLGRVRFFVVGGVSEMLGNGCVKDLCKVVGRIGVARKTVLIENEYSDEVGSISKGWIRDKHVVVEWDSGAGGGDLVVKEGCLMRATPKQALGYILKIGDERRDGDRVVVIFPVARVLEIYATILRYLGRDVIDIHSKTSLGNRARGLEMFKSGGILFGTDTVVEEIEEADIVVSLGIVEEEVYRKRCRMGKEAAVAVVRPEVSGMMKFLGEAQAVGDRKEDDDGAGNVDGDDVIYDDLVTTRVGMKAKSVGYHSLINYYVAWRRRIGWSRGEVIEFVNVWAEEILGEIPVIDRKFAGRRRLIGCSVEKKNVVVG